MTDDVPGLEPSPQMIAKAEQWDRLRQDDPGRLEKQLDELTEDDLFFVLDCGSDCDKPELWKIASQVAERRGFPSDIHAARYYEMLRVEAPADLAEMLERADSGRLEAMWRTATKHGMKEVVAAVEATFDQRGERHPSPLSHRPPSPEATR